MENFTGLEDAFVELQCSCTTSLKMRRQPKCPKPYQFCVSLCKLLNIHIMHNEFHWLRIHGLCVCEVL